MLGDALDDVRTQLAEAGSEREFWNRVSRSGTPRIEAVDDACVRVTLFYRQRPDLRPARVYFDANSLTDHHGVHLTTMTHVAGTGIWFWSAVTSRTWRGSYRFMPVTAEVVADLDGPGMADTGAGVRRRFLGLLEHAVADEFNPSRAGEASLAQMPDAPVQRWWRDEPLAAAPKVLRWKSDILGRSREVWVHQTPGRCSTTRRPLVVLLDGERWVRDQPLAPVLDRATRAGALPPTVYVFIDSTSNDIRGRELPCNREFWRAVIDELLPAVASDTPFTADPGRSVVAGQSYGGLASLYAALMFPERFRLVASQSGSFWWPTMTHGEVRGPAGGHIGELLEGSPDLADLRTSMTVGVHENDMPWHNRRVVEMLRERSAAVRYSEYDGGHDWACWRGELVESLIDLLSEQSDNATDEADHDDQNDNPEDPQEDDR